MKKESQVLKKESQVLVKIHANPMPEACTSYLQWDGPKVFEERLVTPGEAEKLKDKWISLSDFMKEKDFEKNLDEGFDGEGWKIVEANLCQKCKKYNHACAECLHSAFGCNGYEHIMAGDCIDVLPSYPPCSDSLHIYPLVYFNAMKFEVITDIKIIEAFKIVNPSGYVRSYPILDEIDRHRKEREESSNSTTNNKKSSSSTTENKKSSDSIIEVHLEYYPNPPHKSYSIYRGPTGVIYANINGSLMAIGFDSENDGKIKMPTVSQISLLQGTPLNVIWRNGNHDPMSCNEYMQMMSKYSLKLGYVEIYVEYYPDINKPSIIYRGLEGAIYVMSNNQVVTIGFDSENDGKIKIPTTSQKSILREDAPLDIKWRNGNHDPMSCDEYLKMTGE